MDLIYSEKDKSIYFPNPYQAPDDFPLAYGGDLSTKRLIFAYVLNSSIICSMKNSLNLHLSL